jgi:hypothetical protein
MSIDIVCINSMSALRRSLPIADGFTLAARACLLGLCVITEFHLGASPSHIRAMSSANSSTGWRHRAHLRPIESP